MRELVETGKARRVARVGPALHDVREVMIEGPSRLKAVGQDDRAPVYNATRRRLVWPNGAEGFAFSAEDPDSLRGPQFDAAWCDEIGVWTRDTKTRDTTMFAVSLGARLRVVATTTPSQRAGKAAGGVGHRTSPPRTGEGPQARQADVHGPGCRLGQPIDLSPTRSRPPDLQRALRLPRSGEEALHATLSS